MSGALAGLLAFPLPLMGWIYGVGKSILASIFPVQFNLIDSSIISLRTIWALQDLSETELVEMPSCSLAESIHNKWKQQSSDRANDLYVAKVDDFVGAFIQCSAYSQFLKGENPGTGLSKEELKLRRAQRSAAKSGISKPLHEAILKMHGGDEWCTKTPHLEGEEVFVSLKRKPDTAFGDERESH